MNGHRIFWTLLATTALAACSLAQQPVPEPAAPPPPARYDAVVRYDIDAFRNQRLVQFNEMLRFFNRLGFDRAPGPEDEAENRLIHRMSGTIPADQARQLLLERHVRAIQLRPPGSPLPSGDALVGVQLELDGGPFGMIGRFLYDTAQIRALEREGGAVLIQRRLLADQVRQVLAKLGFREAVGYDNRAHTRLLGVLPASALEALLDDLRTQPAGKGLPAPFATRWPLKVVEILPAAELPLSRPEAAPIPTGQEKLTPDLRALLTGAGADKPERLEVILWQTPRQDDRLWLAELTKAAPDLIVEGQAGPLVSVLVLPKQAPVLAALDLVSTVRLPRSGESRVLGDGKTKETTNGTVRHGGLETLQNLGGHSVGIRLAIIGSDFRGWQAQLGKGLPASTRLVDLTAERNADLQPDAFPGDPKAMGQGTVAAVLAAEAGPLANLVLIRIDPAAPYQLLTIAWAMNGDPLHDLNLEHRRTDLDVERGQLHVRRLELNEIRRKVFEEEVDAPDIAKRQDAFRKDQAKFEQDQRALQDRVGRFVQLEKDLIGLKDVRVAACGLAWNEGHPVDGGGVLSRFFDDRPFRSALWFQAAGDSRGQAWAGPFTDRDGDGVMEFLPAGVRLPAGLWTLALNFLAWQPADGPQVMDLPAGARLRLSIQWREPHDPDFLRKGEDVYREPLTPLNILALRQLDPSGTKRPADDFEVVAQSSGLPQRLDNQLSSAVYEQTIEFVVKEPGRYVLQIEGQLPQGIRPKSAPTVPAGQQSWELRPRLFVQTFEGAGRAVLASYVTAEGSIGMPGDARQAITVGTALASGPAATASAPGPVWGLALLLKPNVFALGTTGTSQATAFTAGRAARAISGGASSQTLLRDWQTSPGLTIRMLGD